ncbi:MAG: hypothetical protein JWP25_8230 [Bradyrhizobium sp.]|nr:hypothetical protein [Bradyrhizobium sp.]
MSTVFTANYDSPANTRGAAASVLPTQAATTNAAGTLRQDQLVPFVGRYRFPTITGNLGTLSSLGTNKTLVAGTTYVADLFIPLASVLLTGIGVLNGATVGTDKGIVSLYDATGVLLAQSAAAGATTSGANAFQQYAFTAAYTTIKPGRFFVAYQSNGTTDTIRTIATATWIDVLSQSNAGVFATLPALTPPTTFTADVGPVAYAY